MRLRSLLLIASTIALVWAAPLATADSPAAAPITQPAAPSGKAPIPDSGALKTAAKLVEDVYKDDLANAKTPEQKLAVAQKMLDAIRDERNPATLFTVLTKTLNLACQAADLQSALAVIGRLDQEFNIDALKLRADAAAFVAKTATTPEQAQKFIPLAATLVDAALTADRYDLAKTISSAIADAAQTSKDIGLQNQAVLRLQQVETARQAYDDAHSALAILAGNPKDPDANLKVGKYRCFVKGDWEHGLPMLALSSDESLQSLAKTEIAGVANVDDQLKLADGWWDLSEKSPASARKQLEAHAAQWYQTVMPNLTGLAKIKVSQRLASVEPVTTNTGDRTSPEVANPGNAASRTTNLLALADPTRDSCEGNWALKDGALNSGLQGRCKLQLPYHPPEEYDFHVQFSRAEGNGDLVMILKANGRHFAWVQSGWNNTLSGFDRIAGVNPEKNKTGVHSNHAVENGKIYDVIVKVRKTGLETYVNGKMISEWKTNYAHMTLPPHWQLKDEDALGVGTNDSLTTFSKIEVTEISGMGQFTRAVANPGSGAPRIVDLLPLVDVSKNTDEGKWALDNGELVSSKRGHCILELPYHPPAEYDFHAVVSRVNGSEWIDLILAANGKQFTWAMGGAKNTTFGFDLVAGLGAAHNKTTTHLDSGLVIGKKYDVTVKVRKTGVGAYLDGKSVCQWKTDYSDMTLHPTWTLKDSAAVGLGTDGSSARFSKIEVTEISGPGTFKAGSGSLTASTSPPAAPGLRVPASVLQPYTSPAGPLQVPSASSTPAAAPLTTLTSPAMPFDANTIERPEFANKPKSIVKNITSITAMMVRVSDDGDTLGLTSDIIAAVAPETRNSRDGGAGFVRSKVGEDMKTSFEEAVRAVKLRYPTWNNGRIDISFGEKYTEHDGGSAGTAFGVLLLSSLEGFDIDPKCAVTGDITVDWKVRRVAGVASKIHGAILDKCLYAAIPAANEDVMNDLPLLYGESSLWDIQVLSIATLQQAVSTVRQDRSPQLTEALNLFATLQPALTKSGRVAMHNPATIATLKRIVELAPNHLSARALLAIIDNSAPKTLSSAASLYQFSIIAYPYRNFLNGHQTVTRATLPASVTANARKQIAQLRRIASKEIQPLVTDMAGLIEVAEEAAARNTRSTNFDKGRDALLAHLAAVSANRELLEKLVREAY